MHSSEMPENNNLPEGPIDPADLETTVAKYIDIQEELNQRLVAETDDLTEKERVAYAEHKQLAMGDRNALRMLNDKLRNQMVALETNTNDAEQAIKETEQIIRALDAANDVSPHAQQIKKDHESRLASSKKLYAFCRGALARLEIMETRVEEALESQPFFTIPPLRQFTPFEKNPELRKAIDSIIDGTLQLQTKLSEIMAQLREQQSFDLKGKLAAAQKQHDEIAKTIAQIKELLQTGKDLENKYQTYLRLSQEMHKLNQRLLPDASDPQYPALAKQLEKQREAKRAELHAVYGTQSVDITQKKTELKIFYSNLTPYMATIESTIPQAETALAKLQELKAIMQAKPAAAPGGQGKNRYADELKFSSHPGSSGAAAADSTTNTSNRPGTPIPKKK